MLAALRRLDARWQLAWERVCVRLLCAVVITPAIHILRRLGHHYPAMVLVDGRAHLAAADWRVTTTPNVKPGCPQCWHGVVVGSQGSIPCLECSPEDWDNLRAVEAAEAKIMMADVYVPQRKGH